MAYRLILILLVVHLASPTHAETTGPARVIDGDTIEIAGERIRLHGIDAPEMKQTCRTSKGKDQLCGELAKQALERLVQGQDVTCKGDKQDRYKRPIAVCYVGPININEQMVADGWALAYRKYSKDYVRAETFAKARREGLWQATAHTTQHSHEHLITPRLPTHMIMRTVFLDHSTRRRVL